LNVDSSASSDNDSNSTDDLVHLVVP